MAKAKLSDLISEKEVLNNEVEVEEVKEKRTIVQVIYLTPSEKAYIKEAAKKHRLKLTEYIRFKIMQAL